MMSPRGSKANPPRLFTKTSGAELLSAIRADIISQVLRPGQQVHEEELGKKYGVSRTPIREAFLRLEQEGLVKILPHKGIQISELTNQDIEEIIEIRLVLETSAAKAAAIRVTPEQCEKLREIDKQLDIAAHSRNSVLSFEADSRLHSVVMEAAGNSRVHKIIKSLNSQIMRVRFLGGHRPGRIATSVVEQKLIIRTLIAHDPEKAEKAMRAHLLSAKALLLPSSEMESKFEEMLKKSEMD